MTESDIRFVYFDLGNILYRFDNLRSHRQLASRLGVAPQDVTRVMATEGLADAYERGELTDQEFAQWLCAGLGVDRGVDLQSLMDAAGDMFTLIDGMPDVIASVSQRCQVGILSNTCHAHWQWIVKLGDLMMPCFDSIILSYQVGAMKPVQRIYEVAGEIDCLPAQILFVDDKPDNVAAAVRVGWQAEVCDGRQQTTAALRKHGVIST